MRTTACCPAAFLWLAALAVVAASPTHSDDGGSHQCHDSCEWDSSQQGIPLCFPEGQTWTDSSRGCVQYTCIAKNETDGGSTTTRYYIGALGCPDVRPPQSGPFIKVKGDPFARYPDCCDTYIALKDDDNDDMSSGRHKSSASGNQKQDHNSKSSDSKGSGEDGAGKSAEHNKQSDKSSSSSSSTTTTSTKAKTVQKETVKVEAEVEKKTSTATSSATASSSA